MYQQKIFSNNFVLLLCVKILSILIVYNNNQHHKLKMVHDELSVSKCHQEQSSHAIFSQFHQSSPYWKSFFSTPQSTQPATKINILCRACLPLTVEAQNTFSFLKSAKNYKTLTTTVSIQRKMWQFFLVMI